MDRQMGMTFLIAGIVLMFISRTTLFYNLKKAKSHKEKWSAIIEFMFDPFVGLTSLFYIGLLSAMYGLLRMLNLL